MIVAGRRDPVLCVCLGRKRDEQMSYAAPCGKCRQVLMEFSRSSGDDIWILLGATSDPKPGVGPWFMKLSDLLPNAFGPATGVDLAKPRR